MLRVARLTALFCCSVLAAACGGGGSQAEGGAVDLASLRQALARLASGGDFSGAVLIAKDGASLFSRAYGDAQRQPKVPNRVDTQFNLASMGKMFTGVAVAQLVQAGRLHFDDKVGRYVTELPKSVGGRITVAQLLGRRSGRTGTASPSVAAATGIRPPCGTAAASRALAASST